MPSRNIVCNAYIFGGAGNTMAANASFIGGGCDNFIDSTGPSANPFGVIGGGSNNKICAGAINSSIFSGNKNCVAGSCSSILGGANNYDGGLNNVFIAGSGITAVNVNSLHVNALWAGSIPGPFSSPPGLVAGTVWYGPPGIVGACALYIA